MLTVLLCMPCTASSRGNLLIPPCLRLTSCRHACMLCVHETQSNKAGLAAGCANSATFLPLSCRLIKVAEVQNGGESGVLAARVLDDVQASLRVVQQRIRDGTRATHR